MINSQFKHSELTDKIIRAYYNVYNTLGYGFLEKVYENAMMIELQKFDLGVIGQKPIKVYYDSNEAGSYIADLVVNDSVILELKAAESICDEHEAQLLNYLKASDIEIGLLLNFGKSPQLKKKVFSNEFKPEAIPAQE